jgi:tetratricopeptide (TPR) repeat protein
MKFWHRGFLLLLLPLSLIWARDPARDSATEVALTRVSPAHVEPFRNARVAVDAADFEKAARLLGPICAELPRFAPAFRLFGAALSQLGQREEAIKAGERAVALERSLDNLSTLALILAYDNLGNVTPTDGDRVFSLLRECRSLSGEPDTAILALTGKLAVDFNNLDELRTVTALLQRHFPGQIPTHYLAAILAASTDQWKVAVTEIKLAEEAGLSAESVQKFLDSGVQIRATAWRVAAWTGVGLALWAGGIILLFGVGFLLSKATLRRRYIRVPR